MSGNENEVSNIGLELPGPRIGFGLLRLCTEGRPEDVDALGLIHFALNLGIRILDTADSYCLGESDMHYGEHLVRQALRSWTGPVEEVLVLTKVGLTRPGGRWVPNGRPEHLVESANESLKALGVDQLPLLLLHARDPKTPFEETLATMAELQATGKVARLGLCNVTPAEVQQAQRHFKVAAVQNELSVLNRDSALDGLVAMTAEQEIPFFAHRPLGGHAKTSRLLNDDIVTPLAERHGVSVHELALAALLEASPNVVPLIGATKQKSIRSSKGALEINLDDSDRMALSIRHSFATGSAPTGMLSPVVSSDTPVLTPGEGPGTNPEIVIIMGIQGAGKSEMVAEYVQAGYARLNRDEIGGTLDGLIPYLEQYLQSGQSRVVLDNTYATRTSRAAVIATGHRYGIPVRCRFLNTPIAEARINIVQRMLARYGVPLGPSEMKMFRKMDPNLPPPQALWNWKSSFEAPALDEGFSAIDDIPFVRRVDSTWNTKGVLLDVDGTLRRTKSGEYYPRHPDDIELLPNRTETLQRWVDAGYLLFFVSNQSGVSSGMLSHDAAQACLFRTQELLEIPVTEMVYCPHPAKPVGCFCRKPGPGLGVYLMQRYQLAREHLVMVGDRDTDAGFAESIGVRYVDEGEFFDPDQSPTPHE